MKKSDKLKILLVFESCHAGCLLKKLKKSLNENDYKKRISFIGYKNEGFLLSIKQEDCRLGGLISLSFYDTLKHLSKNW